MRLLVVRHATAVDHAGPGLGDDGRFLTAGGRAEAQDLGVRLRRWGELPAAMFTSPLVRAVQTAEGLSAAGFLGTIVATAALGPDGRLSDLLDEVTETGAPSVAVVGHEPLLSSWTAKLLGWPRLPVPFERAMAVAIDFDAGPAPGTGRLLFATHPRRTERFTF